jgi:hypothetical protein
VIGDVVDLQRYPIGDLDSPFIAHCREALGDQGAVKLDGFIRADAVEKRLS